MSSSGSLPRLETLDIVASMKLKTLPENAEVTPIRNGFERVMLTVPGLTGKQIAEKLANANKTTVDALDVKARMNIYMTYVCLDGACIVVKDSKI